MFILMYVATAVNQPRGAVFDLVYLFALTL